MLVKALKEYTACTTVYKNSEYDLFVSSKLEYRKNILHIKKHFARVIVDLKHTIVPLDSLLQTLQSHYSRTEYKHYKNIQCLWYVCSPHGGIYLYETLAVKEAKKTGKLHNSFIILNSDNGTVSFGPGHKYNKELSIRLGKILEASRFFTREKWLEQIFAIFRLSEYIRYKGSLL